MGDQNFTHTTFGKTGLKICRLGLSASYRPGKETVLKAIDEGINFFFCYGFDTHMTHALRDAMKGKREQFVVATGPYNLLLGHTDFRRTLEKRLRQLRTDYIDVFLFLGVLKEKHFPPRLREELYRLREEGKIRAIGISTHNRKFAGQLISEGALDAIMMRYNAAHRGAEQDIFPNLETAPSRRHQLHRHSLGIPSQKTQNLARRMAVFQRQANCYRFVYRIRTSMSVLRRLQK